MTLWNVVGFILTLGILVGLHEWAHFAVARLFHVKIERFSLGFGRALFRWRGKKDGTEYRIGWIPLGGYVAMAGEDEDSSAALSPEERARTFAAQAAWKRFLIAFAGPAINLLFAVLAFAALYMIGVGGLRPEIEHVRPDSPAARADLQAGDWIRRIDGQAMRLERDVLTALIGGMYEGALSLEIQRGEALLQRHLDLSGLRAGDELDVSTASGLYVRGEWLPAVVEQVLPDSAAAAMDLRPGDEILSINGQAVDLIRFRRFWPEAGEAFRLELRRGSEFLSKDGRMGERDGRALLGVHWRAPDLSAHWQLERYSLLEALQRGWRQMGQYVGLTYEILGRVIGGRASVDNFGGPLTLGDMAGKSLRFGWESFLHFLGVVSLSLAALNLLPIPALDGGHMLLYGLEMLRGQALQPRTLRILTWAGAALLYAFMILLLGRDIWKYWL